MELSELKQKRIKMITIIAERASTIIIKHVIETDIITLELTINHGAPIEYSKYVF